MQLTQTTIRGLVGLFLLQDRGLTGGQYTFYWAALAVFVAAVVFLMVWMLVLELRRQNMVAAVTRMFESYATGEMRAAIRAIWIEPPERFDENPELQNQRRLVYHFWQMAATLAQRGVINEVVLFDLYGDAINIWKKLRPIEVRKTCRALRERHQDTSEEELKIAAEKLVTTSAQNIEWLYKQWNDKTKPTTPNTPTPPPPSKSASP